MTKPSSHDWSGWALLLIDVQKDFWTAAHQQVFPDFPSNTRQLLAFCRSEGIEVVHVRSRFRVERSDWMPPYRLLDAIPCVADTEGAEVLPFAAEAPGEAVFFKTTFDAFQLPELVSHFASGGQRILLTAGLETSYCVLMSSASACQHGFWTLLLEDCCADDPDFDRRTTDDFLERYEGKVLWRTTLQGIRRDYPRWMTRLES